METTCRILDDNELETQPVLKKSDMREWSSDTLQNTRPFDGGYIKNPFPKVFTNKSYMENNFPQLSKNISTISTPKSTLPLLDKIKNVLTLPIDKGETNVHILPIDKGESAASPIELHEPKTPPYH